MDGNKPELVQNVRLDNLDLKIDGVQDQVQMIFWMGYLMAFLWLVTVVLVVWHARHTKRARDDYFEGFRRGLHTEKKPLLEKRTLDKHTSLPDDTTGSMPAVPVQGRHRAVQQERATT